MEGVMVCQMMKKEIMAGEPKRHLVCYDIKKGNRMVSFFYAQISPKQ